MRGIGLGSLTFLAFALGCGAVTPMPDVPDAPEPTPPLERFDVVRCGVDDAPHEMPATGQLTVKADAAVPSPVADALGLLPVAHCAGATHVTDEGAWSLRLAFRKDGTVGEGGPVGERHLTPFARCIMELWCGVPPIAGASGELTVPIRVARPGRDRRIEVAIDPEGGDVTELDQRIVREGARQAAAACAPGYPLAVGAMVSNMVTLTTTRSLADLRRQTHVATETAIVRDTQPEVVACLRERLEGLAWGDRHHSPGPRKLRVVVRWGEDLEQASSRRR